jgi:hypothetical protein
VNMSVGDWSDEGPPGPIPNPEVKLVSADGTWGAAPWESRSLPTGFYGSSKTGAKNTPRKRGIFLLTCNHPNESLPVTEVTFLCQGFGYN